MSIHNYITDCVALVGVLLGFWNRYSQKQEGGVGNETQKFDERIGNRIETDIIALREVPRIFRKYISIGWKHVPKDAGQEIRDQLTAAVENFSADLDTADHDEITRLSIRGKTWDRLARILEMSMIWLTILIFQAILNVHEEALRS